jgi:hypothetical protein
VLRIAILVLLGSGIAHADPPTFSLDLRSKDALADKAATGLEEALRALGSVKTASYRTKGTRKDRVAASTDDCPNALTAACAVAIGTKLGVDYMFTGWVETRNKKLVLTLDVWNTRTGKRVRSLRDYAPNKTDTRKWAKSVYDRIADSSTGSLDITCNAQRASVFLDGQQVTELYQGRAIVLGLVLGTHAIEIRAPGFKTYVDEIEIDGTVPLNILLQR